MNPGCVFRPVARREFDETVAWYEARQTGLGISPAMLRSWTTRVINIKN